MLGNFCYQNPTKIHFGDQALEHLEEELKQYGKKIMLVYGSGSIKKNGLYERICMILDKCGKSVIEEPGVMPNPTVEKLKEGIQLARENEVEFILAVGGGSVLDFGKAVAISVYCDEDPWEKYFKRMEDISCEVVPMGAILTMVGTGSEMDGGMVITDPIEKLKLGHNFTDPRVFPKFAIMDPKITYTVSKYQMAAGIFDILSHIIEQYFSGNDDNTSDYIAEGLLRSLIYSSRIAMADPKNYEARSNIMWIATWAMNSLIAKGKTGDWMVHKIGQSIAAFTDATHGMTLSAVSMAYYRHIMKAGLPKFKRYAVNVWAINPSGKSDEEISAEGLLAMEQFMKEIGVVMHASEVGVTKENLQAIAESTRIMTGGYKTLDTEEIVSILRESL